MGARRATLAVLASAAAILVGGTWPASAQVARSAQAGYYVGTSGITSVQASFVAPTVTCARTTGVQQLRIGIVAPQSNATISEFAQLDATCTDGSLSYAALLSANGSVGVGAVSPGDAVTVRLRVADSGTLSTFANLTTGITYKISGLGQTNDLSAFIGNRPGSVQTAIPTFSSPVHFSDVRVNGTNVRQFTLLRYVQVHGPHTLITTSQLADYGFDLTFVANS